MRTVRRGSPFRNGFSGQQVPHEANQWGSAEGYQVSEDEESRLAATAVTSGSNQTQTIAGKNWRKQPLSALGGEKHRAKG